MPTLTTEPGLLELHVSPQLWNDCRPDLDDSTPQRRVPRLRILVDGYLRPNQQCKASQTQHHTTSALRSSRARWHSTPLRPRVPPMSRRSAGHSWFLLGNLVGEVVVFDASNSIARKQEQARVSTSYRANPETRTKSRLSRKKYMNKNLFFFTSSFSTCKNPNFL